MRVRSWTVVGLSLAALLAAACGGGGGSNPPTDPPPTPTPTPPSAPTNLVATSEPLARIALTWTDTSTSEDAFEVQRSLTSGTGFTTVHTTGPDVTSWTDSGLLHSTPYFYQVRATNTAGESAFTAEATDTADASVWVDAASGVDAWPGGTELVPFKTISFAIPNLGPHGVISINPGTYDLALGEAFPISPIEGQTLIGDVANKGDGTPATTLDGEGPVPGGSGELATIFAANMCTIRGLRFTRAAPLLDHYAVHATDVEVEVGQCTFTNGVYGGVRLIGMGASDVHHNLFDSSSYALRCSDCQDAPVFSDNDVNGTSIPVDVIGQTNNVEILDNTITGSGAVGVHVQHGLPSISGNTFDNAGGYTNGCVRCRFDSAVPVVRLNTFVGSKGVQIDDGSPDLGTAGDPGQNDFTSVTGASIQHDGANTVDAIGNTFPNSPPGCGTDIVNTGGGTVVWGSGAGQQCP